MSARDWKQGDVASIEVPAKLAPGDGGDGWVRIVATRSGGLWVDVRDYNYGFVDTPQSREWRDARPLVVIDPEDREQVAQLALALKPCKAGNRCIRDHCATDRMQEALREFANPTPPKPPEPTGLGAVVEDEGGERWVLVGPGASFPVWAPVNGERVATSYEAINAVRVLSEGVS